MTEGVDLSPMISLYKESLASHGNSPKGVGWRDLPSQHLRFEKLLTVMAGDTAIPIEINDLGCGYGALLDFLGERDIPVKAYHGFDISPEMLDAASRHEAPFPCAFILSDRVTRQADYSLASGVFNLRVDSTDERWIAYIQEVIENLAEHSRGGFSFNLLSTYVDYQVPHLYYADPRWWFDWCKRHVSKRVNLLHDYPLFEWTITVRMD
jgi:SAM-dependent methyltransferase